LIPSRYARVEEARRRFGAAAVDGYLQAALRMDPLADEVVAALERLPLEQREAALGPSLASGPGVKGAPEAVRALVAEAWQVPPWVDFEHLNRGGALVLRGGLLSVASLLCYSLPTSYLSPGGNRPLVMNGGLTSQVIARLFETARFLVETCLPGSLMPGAPGFQRTLRVRLIHARVRRRILATGRWELAELGAPINQADLLSTNLMFSLVGLDGLKEFGLRPDSDEVAAYYALWRYSGQLVGVEPGLLPQEERGAQRVHEMVLALEPPPNDDSRSLTRALLNAPLDQEGEKGRFIHALMGGLTRAFLGAEHADALEVPHSPWRHAVAVTRPLVRVLEVARTRLPWGEDVARGAGMIAWDALLKWGPEGLLREFTVSQQLRHVAQAAVARASSRSPR
jgi:hypothetical protein